MSFFTENQDSSTLGIFYVGQHGNCIPVSPYLYTIWLTLQWSLCLSRTLHFPWMLGKAFMINEAQRRRQRQLNQYLFLWSSQKILLYSVCFIASRRKKRFTKWWRILNIEGKKCSDNLRFLDSCKCESCIWVTKGPTDFLRSPLERGLVTMLSPRCLHQHAQLSTK